MAPRKKSRSFLRSEIAFVAALAEELQEKDFEKVRVVDLLERSGYSRGAFYNKYEDKYCFIDTVYRKLAQLHIWHLAQYSIRRRQGCSVEILLPYSERFFEFVYTHRVMYDLMIDGKIESFTVERFCEEVSKTNTSDYDFTHYKTESGLDMELFSYLGAYDSILLIQYWKRGEYEKSPAYMAKQSLLMIRETYFDWPMAGQYFQE